MRYEKVGKKGERVNGGEAGGESEHTLQLRGSLVVEVVLRISIRIDILCGEGKRIAAPTTKHFAFSHLCLRPTHCNSTHSPLYTPEAKP